MCWVALDRAARLANIRGEAALLASWAQTAAEIKSDILEHGVDSRGVLRQHYDTDPLDASSLFAGIFGFLPPDDARLRATVLAVEGELSEQGYVLRYRTDETDDGLSGKEGSFLICSFWLVSALAIIGEPQRARQLMERLVKSHPRWGCMRRSSTPRPAGTLGTSRRPSRTSHWSRPPRDSSLQRA
jgi:alpha,alpha-trehalase